MWPFGAADKMTAATSSRQLSMEPPRRTLLLTATCVCIETGNSSTNTTTTARRICCACRLSDFKTSLSIFTFQLSLSLKREKSILPPGRRRRGDSAPVYVLVVDLDPGVKG